MRRINPLRISALVLALVLLLGLGVVQAKAEPDWQELQLTLNWTDAAGEAQSAIAVPVAWSTDQSFWAQVTADAPLDQLSLSIAHPNHPEYIFQPQSGTVLQNVADAASLDQITMLMITAADETGNILDVYQLYVSTSVMPSEPTVTDAPAEEPTEEPSVVEPTEEPYVEEPTEEPYVEEPTEEPYVEEPTEESYVEEPTEEPYVEDPTEEPSVEEPTEEPYVEPIVTDAPSTDVPVVEDEPAPPAEDAYHESVDEPAATEAPATDAPAQPAATAAVRISYVDEYGSVIAGPYEVALPGGMTSVIAPDANVLPAGYEPVQVDPISVTVTADGKADRTEIIFSYRKAVVETPIPVGEAANRMATVMGNQVAMRAQPAKTKNNVLKRLEKGTVVYAIQSTKNDKGEVFYSVLYNGEGGYIQADFLDVMTQAASDAYQAANFASPAPVYPKDSDPFATAAPDAPATEIPATEIPATEVPATEIPATEAPATEIPVTEAPATEIPATEVPATDEPTAVPESYSGYALTQMRTALRSEKNYADQTIITTLNEQELVIVDGQEYDDQGDAWSRVATLSGETGLMADTSLRRINDQEADYYLRRWEEANATEAPATPTLSPTPTAIPAVTAAPQSTDVPPQVQGYAYTIGDNVYFRSMPDSYSQILDVLGQHVPVWINGQQYIENEAWHIVKVGEQWGYIRADMLKLMSHTEVADYIKNITATENPQQPTPTPYINEPEALSSYGYVSSTSVNLREKASKSSKKLKTLKQYAFSLILGTTQADGQTWYRISYNGQTGYVDGRYFKQMNIQELEDFLTSKEYAQGIANNKTQAAATAAPGSNGKVLSAEDQNVQRWTNPNSGVTVSYAPFNPFATPAPLTGATAQPNTQLNEAVTTVDPSGQKPDAATYKEYEHLYTTAINGGHTQVESLSQLNGVDITKLSVIESGVYQNLKADSKVIFDPATRKAYVSGMQTATEATIQPVATESIAPMVTTDVLYPQEETQSGSIWGWLVLVIVLLLAGGGVYGYTLFRKGQREAAQRAAAKRAAAQRAGAEGAKPYPQRSPSQSPQRPQTNAAPKQPAAPQGNPYQRASSATPYERPVNANPYARPQTAAPAQPTVTEQPTATPPTQTVQPAQPTQPVPPTRPTPQPAAPTEEDASPSRRRRAQRNRMDDSSTDGGF